MPGMTCIQAPHCRIFAVEHSGILKIYLISSQNSKVQLLTKFQLGHGLSTCITHVLYLSISFYSMPEKYPLKIGCVISRTHTDYKYRASRMVINLRLATAAALNYSLEFIEKQKQTPACGHINIRQWFCSIARVKVAETRNNAATLLLRRDNKARLLHACSNT